jgi:hypothetical protein
MRSFTGDHDHSIVHKKSAFRRSIHFNHCAAPSMSNSTRGGGSILGISIFGGGASSLRASLTGFVMASRTHLGAGLLVVLLCFACPFGALLDRH